MNTMINNIIPSFLKLWESDDLELEVLNSYYTSHPVDYRNE
ncbi:hypothetical protein [Bacillus sp. RE35]